MEDRDEKTNCGASGAALGTTVSKATPGKQVSVPSESLLEFRIEQPVSLAVARGAQVLQGEQ